ncbi:MULTISPECIES: SRPBCC family protein [Streptomyces]|uniref:Coenzyme Q-binding protein COQ10 START domain-containing protein n=2 Tax=Streptomyces TaxID=1883 RepID=Q9RJB0_STRCO|nr:MULTISPECIES: SRPBCC family protein [Streptomyces]MDX2923013.1 SRPBCC family protein [Streptomyces sp. NRRL_B-16638]MDX3408338.1 SRPBCC family protein [Streptomyces sp. ME02-6977A]MYU40179.1 polyketide cyclase [Streptomyces sp. SID7813]NSL79713.1 SRPBCC family protein [Streptomyces coelicolor]QFI40911.1 SRPBCC family protein [Streptomyces coelicolor A3(2)]
MTPDRKGDGGPSPLGDLKDALGGYLSAAGHGLVGRAGDRLGSLTDRLTESADGGGANGGTGGSEPGTGGSRSGSDGSKSGSGGSKSGSGGSKSGGSVKATHIMETVDIGVPLRTVYDQWTQLQDFSDFTKGVQSVSPHDETTSDWTAKIAFSTRSWKATVQEQIPDQRIVWTSEGAKGSTNGVVTFHELAPRLTRVVVVVEYYPAGFFEKTGNLWRAQGRRLRLDLKHFARHVTMTDAEEIEGWRGEIRDGEVVKSHEEALEEDEDAADEYEDDEEGEYDEEESDGEVPDGEEEPYADEDDGEYENDDAYEADDEDDERARPRR